MDRIEKICSYLDKCETLADVGCDHGYCAQTALKNGLCEKVYITDVSAKCLAKAEKLLANEIANGRCEAVCCDGLSGVEGNCEQVLIAGMGGEEILRILKNGFIPRKFVLQPMKNAPDLRAYLIGAGCRITADDIFYDNDKYYFVIKGERSGGTKGYTAEQLLFGRDSLNNPAIKRYAVAEAEKRKAYLKGNLSEEVRKKIQQEYKIYSGVAEK